MIIQELYWIFLNLKIRQINSYLKISRGKLLIGMSAKVKYMVLAYEKGV